jgi:hypothetical protein
LAGDHHFYISFDTEAPGVSLSRRLKEKYPREMTIVLQHRFWDLVVSEERFEVKLTFDGIPERLVVPFEAIKVFFDPSVRFGLQFEDPNAGPEARAQSAGNAFETLSSRGGVTRAGTTRKSPRTRKASSAEGGKPAATGGGASTPPETSASADEARSQVTPLAANSSGNSADADKEPTSSNDAEAPAKPGGAEIVSLDKFRKK